MSFTSIPYLEIDLFLVTSKTISNSKHVECRINRLLTLVWTVCGIQRLWHECRGYSDVCLHNLNKITNITSQDNRSRSPYFKPGCFSYTTKLLIWRRKDMLKTSNKESFDKYLQFSLAVVVHVMAVFRFRTPCIISGLFRRLGVTHHLHFQKAWLWFR